MKEDALTAVKVDNGGILADVVIEASGFKGTEQTALELVRTLGRVVLLGWHTDNINFLFGDMIFKEVCLTASSAIGPEAGLPYAYVRWGSDQSLKWAVDLFAQGKLTGNHIEPTNFSYQDIREVYERIDRRDPKMGMQSILYW